MEAIREAVARGKELEALRASVDPDAPSWTSCNTIPQELLHLIQCFNKAKPKVLSRPCHSYSLGVRRQAVGLLLLLGLSARRRRQAVGFLLLLLHTCTHREGSPPPPPPRMLHHGQAEGAVMLPPPPPHIYLYCLLLLAQGLMH